MRQAQEKGMGLLVAGKLHRLERQFHDAGLDIVGIQESRIQGDIDVQKQHFHILGASATKLGQGGCQIWLARHLKAK
eukprot:2143499-Karenia_brevis.AAC.1